MSNRRTLSAQTVAAIAAELAGRPLTPDRALAYAAIYEPILAQMETLRSLPLKDVEPAVVFHPVETLGHE